MLVKFRPKRHFNYALSNEIFQNIIAYYDASKFIGIPHKLQMSAPSWHRLWVHNKSQIKDLAKSDNIFPLDIEQYALNNKLKSPHRGERDKTQILEAVHTIIARVRELPELHQEVVLLRGRKLTISSIHKKFPSLSASEIHRLYYRFIYTIHMLNDFQYLRFLKPARTRAGVGERALAPVKGLQRRAKKKNRKAA